MNRQLRSLHFSCLLFKRKCTGFYRYRLMSLMQTSDSRSLPSDEPIEEELTVNYDPKTFHRVNPGDTLNNRYRILFKLGFGRSSTVWLVENLDEKKPDCYAALKVNNSDVKARTAAEHEASITRLIMEPESFHEGFPYVRQVREIFETPGQHGMHICVVYELMREPFWVFLSRLKNHRLPAEYLKAYLRSFLSALDYIHSVCHVVHTDLKLDNMYVSFEDPSVLEDALREDSRNPMPSKTAPDGRQIYLSRDDFGPLRAYSTVPKIADFDLARRADGPDPLLHPIQPDFYRAPEVILGASWSYSADIWNLGALIWNLMEDKELFQHAQIGDGVYSARHHLADMIALLGPPPEKLLQREKEFLCTGWNPPIANAEGKMCYTARELFGGPFFDENGEFLHRDLVPEGYTLENSVESLEGQDKRLFLEFAQKMLRWLPEERATAKELLLDPWMKATS